MKQHEEFAVVCISGGCYAFVDSVTLYADFESASDAMKQNVLEYMKDRGIIVSEYSREAFSQAEKDNDFLEDFSKKAELYDVEDINVEDVTDKEFSLMSTSYGEYDAPVWELFIKWEVVNVLKHH